MSLSGGLEKNLKVDVSNVCTDRPLNFSARGKSFTQTPSSLPVANDDIEYFKKYYFKNKKEFTIVPETDIQLEEVQLRSISNFFLHDMQDLLEKNGVECVVDVSNHYDIHLKIYPSEFLKKELRIHS